MKTKTESLHLDISSSEFSINHDHSVSQTSTQLVVTSNDMFKGNFKVPICCLCVRQAYC